MAASLEVAFLASTPLSCSRPSASQRNSCCLRTGSSDARACDIGNTPQRVAVSCDKAKTRHGSFYSYQARNTFTQSFSFRRQLASRFGHRVRHADVLFEVFSNLNNGFGGRDIAFEEEPDDESSSVVSMDDIYTDLAGMIVDQIETMADRGVSKHIVAIAGCPGSGKSTTATAVCHLVNDEAPGACVVLPMDGFHLYRSELAQLEDPEEALRRRGAPWTFNPKALASLLRKIKDDGEAVAPSFDHSQGDPVERAIPITKEHRVVLLEGNYVLLQEGDWKAISQLVDETWFIDVDLDIAMQRVVKRHMAAWGWSEEQARERVEYNDRPNAELIAAASRDVADIVVMSFEDPPVSRSPTAQ